MHTEDTTFTSFKEFWPFYLSQHQNAKCRLCHFLGTAAALFLIGVTALTHSFSWFVLALVMGYSLAWLGHFVFEKNRPATFQYPLYSLVGDWKMFWMMLSGKIKF